MDIPSQHQAEEIARIRAENAELREVLKFVMQNPSEEAYWLTQVKTVLGGEK